MFMIFIISIFIQYGFIGKVNRYYTIGKSAILSRTYHFLSMFGFYLVLCTFRFFL